MYRFLEFFDRGEPENPRRVSPKCHRHVDEAIFFIAIRPNGITGPENISTWAEAFTCNVNPARIRYEMEYDTKNDGLLRHRLHSTELRRANEPGNDAIPKTALTQFGAPRGNGIRFRESRPG